VALGVDQGELGRVAAGSGVEVGGVLTARAAAVAEAPAEAVGSGATVRAGAESDAERGVDLSDTLKWVKFSNIAWTKDHKGFFYSRYEQPKSENAMLAKNTGQKLYYHRVGEPQAKDQLILERPDHPRWVINATVSDDGEYVVIYIVDGTNPNNRIFFIDLGNPGKPKIDNPLVRLIDDEESENRVIDNAGDVFFLQTSQDAPLGRVVAVDINKPAKKYWRPLIAEGADKMEDVELIGGHFVVSTLKDAHSVLQIYALRGNLVATVKIPGIGTVAAISGKPNEWEMFYSYVSYLQPASVYRYDIEKRVQTSFLVATVPVDSAGYETKQLFASGKDGTKIPVFVTSKKGLTLDGSHPTILYAYGGFDINETPAFSPSMLQWVAMGGVYAVAVIRGGGSIWSAARMAPWASLSWVVCWTVPAAPWRVTRWSRCSSVAIRRQLWPVARSAIRIRSSASQQTTTWARMRCSRRWKTGRSSSVVFRSRKERSASRRFL